MNLATGFLLRGLKKAPDPDPSTPFVRFLVDPNQTYDVEILTPNGMPLSSNFSCSYEEGAAGSGQTAKIAMIDGCRFSMKGAVEGTLQIRLAAKAPTGYTETLLFDLVKVGWTPPVLTGLSFALSDEQKLEEYEYLKQKIARRLRQRELDKKNGLQYANDNWYVDYLRQLEADLDAARRKLGGKG